MQIRDLECKAGLDRATIRFYEKESLIVPARKENGYREYSNDNLACLLKIKLLRQLGMPLETIKGIQQGSTDFSQALSIQIERLEGAIDAAVRAREVCTELYRLNTCYESLDAGYYLRKLNSQPINAVSQSFYEPVNRHYHPIRRFLARMTDYAILRILLEFLIIVVLRIRPYSEFLSGIISYSTPFLMIPIAAYMIHKWGRTPGKWIYGISVLSEDGCKLTFTEAKEREWQVLSEGYGFGIPVWSVYRQFKSYKAYRQYDLDWDTFCECQFKDWNETRKKIIAISAALITVVNLIVVTDAMKPRFRGDVTVSEFAANYNFYHKLLTKQPATTEMRTNGTWYPEPSGQVTIDLYGTAEYPNKDFEFLTDGSLVETIRYENTWTDVFALMPVTYRCQMAAITAVMSQKGMGFYDCYNFAKMLDNADLFHDGKLTYKNISISWEVDTENCMLLYEQHYTAEDNTKPSKASVQFQITINN